MSSSAPDREDAPVLDATLFAPFPYHGNKRRAAPLIWQAIGDVPNYVTGFGGALGDIFGRPETHHPKIETANDLSGHVTNVMRALKFYPTDTAFHADWWVNELDLHARHAELVRRVDAAFVERLRADPKFCDPELAGWWIWGIALWIGAGWCAAPGGREGDPSKHKKRPATGGQGGRPHLGRGVHADRMPQKRPHMAGNGSARLGSGVHAHRLPHLAGPANPVRGQLPHLAGCDGSGVGYGRGIHSSAIREDILGFFQRIAARLRRVRVTCGDFARVLTEAVTESHGLTGVLLDPPYGEEAKRCEDLYECDDKDAAPRARQWALEHGDNPRYRIVLCGYEGEHDMPASWRCVAWKSSGASKNSDRERLWLSPHCEGGTAAMPLFAQRAPQETSHA
jgi:hypothetical protein